MVFLGKMSIFAWFLAEKGIKKRNVSSLPFEGSSNCERFAYIYK
jgi:hypothetical protein